MATTKKITVSIDVEALGAEEKLKLINVYVKQLEDNVDKATLGTKKHSNAVDKLNKEISRLGTTTKTTTKSTEKSTVAHKNSTSAIQAEISRLTALRRNLDVTSQEYKQLGVDIQGLTGKMNMSSSSTGLASSAALELGRVVSDAPYGIRGMANNVSQLASQILFLSSTTNAATGKVVGFSGAIKGLWRSLMGPLGVLLAIQAAISALDYFYGSTKKAEEASDDLADSFDKLAGKTVVSIAKVEAYADSYKNATKGTREHINALKELNKLGFDPTIDKIDEFIEKQMELIIVQATLGEYAESLKFLADARSQATDLISSASKELGDELKEFKDKIDEAKDVQERGGGTQFVSDQGKIKAQEMLNDLVQKRANIDLNQLELTEKYKQKIKELLQLTTPKAGGSRSSSRGFRQRFLDLQREIISFGREEVNMREATDKELLELSQKYDRLSLEAKKDRFLKNEEARIRRAFSSEEKIQEKLSEAKLQAETEYNEALTELQKLQAAKRFEQQLDALTSFNDKALQSKIDAKKAELAILDDIDGEVGGIGSLDFLQNRQRDIWDLEDEQFEESQRRLGEKLYQEYGSWLEVNTILDENKRAYEMERAQEEVDLEKDKIDRKREINEEYIGWVQGLGSVFSSIGKDNEALAAAGLVLEKGAAIAGIIVQTQAANAQIFADGASAAGAYGKAAASSAASVGGGIQGLAAAAPYIALQNKEGIDAKKRVLKNNIGAGISIAKIAATTLTSGGSPSGGGGGSSEGGGGSSFTPSFNVVGNSGENQLAQSISNQVNTPTQAFVVYEDILEAGRLEDNAIEASGIG
jgi:hypothetical protein